MAQATRSRISEAQRALVALALANSAVGAGLHDYLWLRLVAATALGAPWQRVGACLFAGLALYVPVGLALVALSGRTPLAWSQGLMRRCPG